MCRSEEGVCVWDIGEVGCLGIIKEIIEQHACMALDGLLAVWAVEKSIVDTLEGERRIVCQVGATKCSPFGRFGRFLAEKGVGAIECCNICYDGNGTVDHRVFGGEVWFIKVVCVAHVVSMDR